MNRVVIVRDGESVWNSDLGDPVQVPRATQALAAPDKAKN